MSILEILNEIAATSSTKEKEAILCREKNNTLLKEVFAATYNPLISYHINAIPSYTTSGANCSLSKAIEYLGKLSSRVYTGTAGIGFLASILSDISKEDATVIERIIDRDLRCGCSDTIAARIWPGIVPVFDVMLCDSDLTRITYPAYINLKCDGARVHLFMTDGSVKAMSRSGKEFQLLGALDLTAKKFMKEGDVFDGELLVVKNGKILERKLANGILNKANKGTISQEEADMVVAVLWDVVDYTGTKPYNERFDVLRNRLSEGEKFALVPWKIVHNEDEAMAFFDAQIKNGEEGAVLKNMKSKWIPKRSKELCKLKSINSADLIVVDIVEGTGKYVGMLGKFICETSDGKLQVGVGSGFSDEERIKYWSKDSLGMIVEALYNQTITSKGKDKASLFLPRFSSVRFDKSVANSIEELK